MCVCVCVCVSVCVCVCVCVPTLPHLQVEVGAQLYNELGLSCVDGVQVGVGVGQLRNACLKRSGGNRTTASQLNNARRCGCTGSGHVRSLLLL